MDGQFVCGVRTTGIYCKPSCPAAHGYSRNYEYFFTIQEARDAGYRACLRCRPDEIGRDREAVLAAIQFIETAETRPTLAELAKTVGYTPHHFQRIFKRDIGISPAMFIRARRTGRAMETLIDNERIVNAIYDAGYETPSRFYADAERLGMTPSAWRNGGKGETIRYAIVASALGPMLVAATGKGTCRLSFDESERDLRDRFPNAHIVEDDGTMTSWIEGALQAVAAPLAMPDLPLDVTGTAFQEAVWQELKKIPSGETRSYAEIAAAVGKPNAVRAAGSANGANNVAVLIPCHRVVRSDGSLGGYAYGLERKKKLLESEKGNGR